MSDISRGSLSESPAKRIDLHKYTTKECKVFAGRDRGEFVRKDCGVEDGDRVHLILPEGTMALAAGFADELLRDTIIVEIEEIGGSTVSSDKHPRNADPPPRHLHERDVPMTADSPLKLDERTEQLIRGVMTTLKPEHPAHLALRQRIKELVDEAEQNGIRVMARVANEKPA